MNAELKFDSRWTLWAENNTLWTPRPGTGYQIQGILDLCDRVAKPETLSVHRQIIGEEFAGVVGDLFADGGAIKHNGIITARDFDELALPEMLKAEVLSAAILTTNGYDLRNRFPDFRFDSRITLGSSLSLFTPDSGSYLGYLFDEGRPCFTVSNRSGETLPLGRTVEDSLRELVKRYYHREEIPPLIGYKITAYAALMEIAEKWGRGRIEEQEYQEALEQARVRHYEKMGRGSSSVSKVDAPYMIEEFDEEIPEYTTEDDEGKETPVELLSPAQTISSDPIRAGWSPRNWVRRFFGR